MASGTRRAARATGASNVTRGSSHDATAAQILEDDVGQRTMGGHADVADVALAAVRLAVGQPFREARPIGCQSVEADADLDHLVGLRVDKLHFTRKSRGPPLRTDHVP